MGFGRAWITDPALVAGAAVVYLAAAGLATQWFGDDPSIKPLWLATPAVLALALLLPHRHPGVVLVGLVIGEVVSAQFLYDVSAGATGGSVLSNAVEFVVAFGLLRHVGDPDRGIVRVRESMRWIAASIVAGLVGALIAMAVVLDGPDRLGDGVRWWAGDSIGLILVGPLALSVRSSWLRAMTPGKVAELVASMVGLAVCCSVAFTSETPLIYFTIPWVGWIAVRFGFRASSPAAVGAVVWATIEAARGRGPFSIGTIDAVTQVQAYNVAIGVTALVLAALATRSEVERVNLLHTAAERRRLEHQLASVRVEERSRIARRLHDEVIQVLTAADLHLGAAKRKIDDADADADLDVVSSRIHLAIDQLRLTISDLAPVGKDVDSLSKGLHAVADLYRYRNDGVRFEIDAPPIPGLDVACTTAVYRIAREAVANAALHAAADLVRVTLTDRGHSVELLVDDNGVGIDERATLEAASGHLGLRLMRERAMSVGGDLAISRLRPDGCRVAAMIPKHATR